MVGVISSADDKDNKKLPCHNSLLRSEYHYILAENIWDCRQAPDKLLKPDRFGGSDPGDQVGGPDHH